MLTWAADQYELVDFGGARKLERFGPYLLDRPSPAATAPPRLPGAWEQADARYDRSSGERGTWTRRRAIEEPWQVRCGPLAFELKLTPFGHVGLFPEQVDNWSWIDHQAHAAGRPLEVLNLFAYTGGSTLAAAAAGCSVTHVDAAANIVSWACRNAQNSQLAQAPIRWITEDALKYARRELKRGRRYDAVILDPPTYGHGSRGEPWKLAEHLDELWALCRQLMTEKARFSLLTCHATDFDLASWAVQQRMDHRGQAPSPDTVETFDMDLRSAADERLHCGRGVRWRHGAGIEEDRKSPLRNQATRKAWRSKR